MHNQERTLTPERLQVLDVLRGCALLGILLINSMSILAVKGSTPAFTVQIPFLDRLLQDLILFFVESKFFTLFSLLFGIGFAIQIQSAERQGSAFLPRILRRMFCLFLFGTLHVVFLWDGDILVIYAVTGTLLILFRTLSTRTIKRLVIGLLAIPAALVLAIFVATLLFRITPSGGEILQAADQSLVTQFANTAATEKLLQSGFTAGITERIHTYVDLLPLLLSRIPTVLAMFLIGMSLGRSNFVSNMHLHVVAVKRIRFWGLCVGFALMVMIVLSTKFLPPLSGLIAIIEDQYLAGPLLCLGYAAAISLDFYHHPNRKLYSYFSNVGRTALTNYLLQSLVLTFLSYGWGVGLAMQLSGFEVLAICALLFSAQVALSSYWLSRFEFGPLEWLWRFGTYLSKPRLRRS